MAEACRPKKTKLRDSDLLSQLEKLSVPDHDIPSIEDPVPEISPEANKIETLIPSEENRDSSVAADPTCDLVDEVPTGAQLYFPVLDELQPAEEEMRRPADTAVRTESEINVRPSISFEKSAGAECELPLPLDLTHLANLYINRSLENVPCKESEFLVDTLSESSCFLDSQSENNSFEAFLQEYIRFWSQWKYAVDRFSMVCSEAKQLEKNLWTLKHKNSSVNGKCKDGYNVSLEYTYQEAELNENNAQELLETEDVMRWIVFEELPIVAYSLARLRNRINEFILDALTQSSNYLGLSGSEPTQLLPSVTSEHEAQLRRLRSICNVLFAKLRQQYSAASQGAALDPAFTKQLRNWISLTAGTMIRVCRAEDHLFILMHLLRLHSKQLRHLLGLLNPPDAAAVWKRSPSVVEFLHQPEVELSLTLFAVCLRPVRERGKFVTVVCSEANGPQSIGSGASSATMELPWVVVDSAGESDLEDNCLQVPRRSAESCEPHTPPSSTGSPSSPEPSRFVSPRDLDRLLKQLNFGKLIQLIAYDGGSVPGRDTTIEESGLLTLLAFANRLLGLIESCGDIYSNHVDTPRPQTHLGAWRVLAKRLARLICLLVTAVGSRMHHVRNQQESFTNPKFAQTLAQYDAFCLRAAQCLLFGCGLPSTHKGAVRLVCWRHLASLFPFGMVATRSKLRFLHMIIQSVIPSWNVDSDMPIDAIPANVTVPLHRALLTIGLNELGLEAILTTLGKLAACECRPLLASPNPGNPNAAAEYQLPTMEAELICSIVRIIFRLAVFPEQSSSTELTGRFNVIASLPIAPERGREQLVAIVSAHPQVALDLLLNLIVESGEELSTSEVSSLPRRTIFGSSPFGEHLGSQQLILSLVAEAPLHIWRPDCEQISRLIGWLVNQSPTSFPHLLTRIILHRLNWEAVLSPETGEPFLPFASHLELALALAQFVDKHLRFPARFNAFPLPPVINQLQSTARSSASALVGTLLTGLGYRSSEVQSVSTPPGTPQKSGHTSRTSAETRFARTPRTNDHHRRSRSQGPSSVLTEFVESSQPMLSWCVDLLLRLHLPGCVAVASYCSAAPALKSTLSRALQLLDTLNMDRNPLVPFLVLSLNVKMFGTSSSDLPTDACLSRAFKSIIDSRQSNLIVRTFSLVFHQFASVSLPTERPALTKALCSLIQLHRHGQLYHQVESQPLSLILGSCLDAAINYPYTCHTFLRSLVPMFAQSNWLENPDSVFLLEVLLQIDLWVHRSYIPGKLNSPSDLAGWDGLNSIEALETLLKDTHVQKLSTNTTNWIAQLAPIGAAATWAWQQSSKAIYGLTGRILGATGDGEDPAHNQSLENPSVPKSLLQTFWPQIVANQPKNRHDNAYGSLPFWLLTVIHRLDLKLQFGVESQEQPRVWSSLTSVLTKHVDELVLAIYNSSAPSEQIRSSLTPDLIDPTLMSLLETILLEADILPPACVLDKESENLSNIMRSNRVRAILLHLPLIQGISLFDACPLEDPVLLVLLHTVLLEVFGFVDQSYRVSSESRLPVGFLLLRCLRWSLFQLPIGTVNTDRGRNDDRRTLLDILNNKLKSLLVHYGSSLNGDRSLALRAIHNIVNLLSDVDSLASRSAFGASGQTTLALTPSFQRDTIDALLGVFDWRELNNRLKPYMELWNKHRLSTIAFTSSFPVEANQPRDVFSNLRQHQQSEIRYEIPFYSLEKLRSVSISALLPKSVDGYLVQIQAIVLSFSVLTQDLRNALAQHIKRMCDRIELIEELQNYYRITLVPNLYKITNVQKSEQVECKSILPSWMTGSKRCLGGVHLTCTYQTAEVNKKIEGPSGENRNMVQELLKQALESAHLTASTLMTDELEQSISSDQTDWARLGLRLELSVSHLVRLSHTLVTMGGQTSNSADLNRQSLRAIGLSCFEHLCQNLTGPLLSCPVSKKLIADCIQQLAGEFLTSVSAGYERVLDLLVALPHLSGILQPAFIPPTPGLYPPVSSRTAQAHPLYLVYSRLMDIRFRCSPDIALKILQTVDASIWFGQSELHRLAPPAQYTALVPILVKCVTQTRPTSENADVNDRLLHELCLKHLQLLLSNRLPDLLSPLCVLLLQEIEGRGGLLLSTDVLVALLNKLTAVLSETVRPITGSSEVIELNELLFDRLIYAPSELVSSLLAVFQIFLSELAMKLARCVRENGMSVALAGPVLITQLVGLLGSVLMRCCAANYSSQLEPEGRRVSVNVGILLGDMVSVLRTAVRGESSDVQSSCIMLVSTRFNLSVDILVSVICVHTILKDEVIVFRYPFIFVVCPPDAKLQWSSTLIDCFVRWLLVTPCVTSKPHHSSIQRDPITTGSPKATARQTSSPGSSGNILLGTLLCSVQTEDEEAFSSLSFSASLWRPSLASLNAMIEVGPGPLHAVLYMLYGEQLADELMLNSCQTHGSVPQASVASLIARLLESVNWTDTCALMADECDIRPVYPHWTPSSSSWCPSDVGSTDRRLAFMESLTFLLVLLCQALHGAPIQKKSGVQQIIEAVVGSIRLSSVGERYYLYVLSHLADHSMPSYTVLLPPTSMEGRMFGLLASVAGMVANPETTDASTSPGRVIEWGTTSTFSNLYPKLTDIPTCSAGDRALHQKRLAYVRKITGLVQASLLRGIAPTQGFESLLSGLDLSRTTSTPSDEPSMEKDSGFLSRLTQPLGVFVRKIIPTTLLSTTQEASSTDPAHVLAILAWLRISNLLSELEAFAGSSSWKSSAMPEFRNVAELCSEVINLMNVPRTSLPKSAAPSATSQLSVLVQRRPLFFRSAMTHWLLGGAEADQTLSASQLPVPLSGLMPRSIHAGLSRPICYALLTTTPHADEECAVASVQLLDAALWSVFIFASNHLSPNDRLSSLTTLFSELTEQQSFNLNVHCCLRDGRLLPVYMLSQTRLSRLGSATSGTDSHSILVADLLHWLGIVNLNDAVGGTSLQLHAMLLYLSFLIRVVDRHGNSVSCGSHPGWSTQQTEVANSKCPVATDVSRLVLALSGLKKSLGKLKPHNPLSNENVKTFSIYIECVGSLLEAWLGHRPSAPRVHFTPLEQMADAQNIALPQEQQSSRESPESIHSIIVSTIARLPTWTLTDAFTHLSTQFWPEIRSCVKQLMLHCDANPPEI
ncbi:hypothetical protein X801_04262 [Opisthorchis viverrini]|uniref:Epg5-like central TPR repeats domain-containing protein n=1 Tax=Opisthorchis viverrini TaxID=6198 RepID=A0A1S8WZI7_OPIVI|nr:hypothetical protein X801_04262 [Opisthorchis viverrini]